MNLEIDATDWDEKTERMIHALGGEAGKPVSNAVRRALRKAAQWLQRQVTRVAATEIGVTQSKFKKARVSVSIGKGSAWTARIWVGTDPWAAHRLGAVKWTRKMAGARAGRRLFPGTFVPRQGGPIFKRSGAGRLPIEKETVEIDAAMQQNIRRLETSALSRFRQLLAQELNYELQKSIGNA